MAVIHQTTMQPTKVELLTDWLPKQSWYLGGAGTPVLAKAGGFRLDDPAGEVGIEFVVVVDTSAAEPVAYLVPMGYRGAPLDGVPETALVGTSEHGVLGTRWLYDGAHDPVVREQLRALMNGGAVPQDQDEDDTPDLTVTVHGAVGDGEFDVRLSRVLRAGAAQGDTAQLVAEWTWPEGSTTRGVFATAVR
ncbi:1,4-alpha-glucan branching protein [Kitasatospora sp. RB6PN24]|uniref:maltokinase N-terminal cap-like domain-containing protein n=1 Tax=Kitasatospora humi TaxID=2893891 RepID=UPI001E4BC7FC|nr:1,4-alpha-glucan branching protein [Kitasatospora humi]MCC9309007.1 1,4-alpha-glucan branching protein [Kitasatospora humi]